MQGQKDLKLIVVGDGAVGKTCALLSYVTDKFPTEYVPTIFENTITKVKVNGQDYGLSLWDTAGQEGYENLRQLSYQGTDIFLICFSVVNQSSFENALNKWINEVGPQRKNGYILFLGLKTDLRNQDDKNHITMQVADISIRKMGYDYREASALTQEGLKDAFSFAISKFLQQKEEVKKTKKKAKKFLYNQEAQPLQKKPEQGVKLTNKRKVQLDLGGEVITKKPKTDEVPNLMEKLFMNPIDLVKQTKQYSFGNYKKYYNIRLKQKWEDPRLTVLDGQQYFTNKSILDIGCNDGTLTLLIALKFFPQLIRGIDIDYQLINKAIEQMVELDDQQKRIQKQEFHPIIQDLPTSFEKYMNDPSINTCELVSKAIDQQAMSELVSQQQEPINEKAFPNNVYFRVQNIIGNKKYEETYDTVLCLSVTKWIHLNFGDIGIKRLFKKFKEFTKIGGHLILEPQEWKSYKKKKYYSHEFKQTYKDIKLKPEQFTQELENSGFKLVQSINPDDETAIKQSKSTFRRPLMVYQRVE